MQGGGREGGGVEAVLVPWKNNTGGKAVLVPWKNNAGGRGGEKLYQFLGRIIPWGKAVLGPWKNSTGGKSCTSSLEE